MPIDHSVSTIQLISPHNGRPLAEDAPNLLSDGELRWPVIDGIAYLRPRHELREAAVALLEEEKETEALAVLLQDQDPFAPIPPPDKVTLRKLISDDSINLRDAMGMLNYGPVADYFAYRWATPTYLSGLALLQRMGHAERPVVEVACGMGHFLSTLEANGATTVGLDLVFSKLWLARRYLSIKGDLVCGDIEQVAPLTVGQPASVFCHDAFYFFEHKSEILNRLRQLAGGGPVAVGHVHTNAVDHNVAGYPKSVAEYQRMATNDASFFDDNQLAKMWLDPDQPPSQATSDLSASEAIAWVEGEVNDDLYALHQPANSLKINPLLDTKTDRIHWPTDRFRQEYEADASYLKLTDDERNRLQQPDQLSKAQQSNFFRRRILLDLPERW